MENIFGKSQVLINLAIEGFYKAYKRISQTENNAEFATEFPSLKRNVQQEFAYTTRYLNVDQALQGKDILEIEIGQLTSALLEGNWKADIFKDDKRFPYIALQAFKDAKIGKEEFTNVMFYWSIRQHHPIDEIQVFSLYDACQYLNEPAADALLKTMKPVSISQTHLGKNIDLSEFTEEFASKLEGSPFLNSTQQQLFLDRLKTLPRSAQTFFVIPDIQVAYESKNLENMAQDISQGKISISQEIQKSPRVNMFNRIEINGLSLRMVPSCEMMQEAVKAMSPEHGVTLLPTVGISGIEDIRQNGLSSTRDLGIPFPGVTLPQTADELRCTELYDFFYHDFYHAIQASCVPHEDRVKFIRLSDIALRLAQNETQYRILPNFVNQLQERLLDMEHGVYNLATSELQLEQLSKTPILSGKDVDSYKLIYSIDLVMMAAISRLSIYQAQEKRDGTSITNLVNELYWDVSCSQFSKKLMKKVIQLFSGDTEGQKGFCEKIINWGKITQQMLPTLSHISNLSVTEHSIANWAVQGKELCQNPWLLASV